jgi:hypothetical protein
MTDSQGNTLASESFTGNNFSNNGDQTVHCEGSVGGWADGFFNVELTAPYDRSMGDVMIKITNTLDQGAGDESIGYGEMRFTYDFEDGRSPNMIDVDEEEDNPTALWTNDCGAT